MWTSEKGNATTPSSARDWLADVQRHDHVLLWASSLRSWKGIHLSGFPVLTSSSKQSNLLLIWAQEQAVRDPIGFLTAVSVFIVPVFGLDPSIFSSPPLQKLFPRHRSAPPIDPFLPLSFTLFPGHLARNHTTVTCLRSQKCGPRWEESQNTLGREFVQKTAWT